LLVLLVLSSRSGRLNRGLVVIPPCVRSLLLCDWADHIIVTQEGFVVSFQSKVWVCDVGPDRWGPKLADELSGLITVKVNEWKARRFV
jgi:hypothetical protein